MRTTSIRPYTLAKRQRGAAAVEFAVTVFVLLVIGAGIVEFGRAFWYYDAISKGTRDAARYLSTVPTGSLSAAAASTRAIVVNTATAGGVPGFADTNVDIACMPVACAVAALPTDVTRVTVSAHYAMDIGALFPFIASASGNGGAGGSGTFGVNLTPHTTMPYLW